MTTSTSVRRTTIELPTTVQLDAWTGEAAARGELADDAKNWGAKRGLPASRQALPFGPPADPTNWAHEDVGYGVLLLDDDTVDAKDKAAGADAPAPVRNLLAKRPGTVLLRWSRNLKDLWVRRYYPDGTFQDVLIGLTKFGVAPGNRLPRYVLIVAPPDQIPWSVQYSLAAVHAVGRLPFTGDALGPYLDAMLDGWAGSTVDVQSPLIWTVDHGPRDITRLMRAAITAPLDAAFTGTLTGLRHLQDKQATAANLLTECARTDNPPALVVTSSHGSTPIGDHDLLAASLGLPVDVGHQVTGLDDLATAMPAGCVWFAQACCSAGGAGRTHYEGLLKPGTSAHTVVTEVAGLGPTVSPAALALLGRAEPVRAVLGHVEPTFNWTLRSDDTGQSLGGTLVVALSSNLHHGQPLGYAFAQYRAGVGQLYAQWAARRDLLEKGDTSLLELMTRLRLTAVDRQSLVLLGDPTVTLPPLA